MVQSDWVSELRGSGGKTDGGACPTRRIVADKRFAGDLADHGVNQFKTDTAIVVRVKSRRQTHAVITHRQFDSRTRSKPDIDLAGRAPFEGMFEGIENQFVSQETESDRSIEIQGQRIRPNLQERRNLEACVNAPKMQPVPEGASQNRVRSVHARNKVVRANEPWNECALDIRQKRRDPPDRPAFRLAA